MSANATGETLATGGTAGATITQEGGDDDIGPVLAAVAAEIYGQMDAAMKQARRSAPRGSVTGLLAAMRRARQTMLGAARQRIIAEARGRRTRPSLASIRASLSPPSR